MEVSKAEHTAKYPIFALSEATWSHAVFSAAESPAGGTGGSAKPFVPWRLSGPLWEQQHHQKGLVRRRPRCSSSSDSPSLDNVPCLQIPGCREPARCPHAAARRGAAVGSAV